MAGVTMTARIRHRLPSNEKSSDNRSTRYVPIGKVKSTASLPRRTADLGLLFPPCRLRSVPKSQCRLAGRKAVHVTAVGISDTSRPPRQPPVSSRRLRSSSASRTMQSMSSFGSAEPPVPSRQ
jgi:hypothetical protein